MIFKVQNSLISIVVVLIAAACQNDETFYSTETKKFLNIQKANKDIKESASIDVLQYKSDVDKAFRSDSFYVELCENILFNTGQSDIYLKFGNKLTFDNGDSIKLNQQDTLFVRIFHSLADNVCLDDCNSSSSDTLFCQTKIRIRNSYKAVNGVAQLSPSTTYGYIYDMFRNGYLNYDELAFMCIVLHVVRDISYIEEQYL